MMTIAWVLFYAVTVVIAMTYMDDSDRDTAVDLGLSLIWPLTLVVYLLICIWRGLREMWGWLR